MISFILFLLLIGIFVLFLFLHERVENLAYLIRNLKEDMTTLYANQETLNGDIKKIFNELQSFQKEIAKKQK